MNISGLDACEWFVLYDTLRPGCGGVPMPVWASVFLFIKGKRDLSPCKGYFTPQLDTGTPLTIGQGDSPIPRPGLSPTFQKFSVTIHSRVSVCLLKEWFYSWNSRTPQEII